MSTDIDPDTAIAGIKTRLALAQRTRIRAEHQRDAAAAQADKARQQLQDDFGVTTVDEANAMLAALEHDRDQALAALTRALGESGA